MERARSPIGIIVLLGALQLAALGWALTHGAWEFPDSDRYWQAAQNLVDYHVLYARPWTGHAPIGKDVQELTIRTIGYPMLVGVLDGKKTVPLLTLLLQGVMSVLCMGSIWWAWVKTAQPSQKHWVPGLALVITFPAQFIYAGSLMSETLLQSVVVVMAVFAGFFLITQRTVFLAGACFALIVALLIKPVFYPLSGFALIAGAVVAWRFRRLSLALIGLLPALAVGAYMGWNLQRTGYFHFSSIADINLLHYNAAGVIRQLDGAQAEERWVASVLRAADAQPNFGARQQVISTYATRVLWEHPFVYGWQHLIGMGAFFVDPGRFDMYQFFQLPAPEGGGMLVQIRSGRLMRALQQLPLGMLSLLGVLTLANVVRLGLALRGFRRLGVAGSGWKRVRWVLAGLPVYVALLTGPLGAARFLVPVWPLLLALALAGVAPPRDRRIMLETK